MKLILKKLLVLFLPLFFLLPTSSARATETNIDGATLYEYQSTHTDGVSFLTDAAIIYPQGATKIDKVYVFFHGINPPCSNCHFIDPVAVCRQFKLCQKVADLGNIAILFPQMDPQSGLHAAAFTEDKFDKYINEALGKLHTKIIDSPNSISVVMAHGSGTPIIEKYLDYYSTDTVIIFNGCYEDWCENIFPKGNKFKNIYVYIVHSPSDGYVLHFRAFDYNHLKGRIKNVPSLEHYQVPEKCFSDHLYTDEQLDYSSDCKEIKKETGTAYYKSDVLGIDFELRGQKPKLEIDFPGLAFSDVTSSTDNNNDTYFFIPWIGEFISALYKFAIGIVSIVAVIIIIVQGVRIIASGGGEHKAEGYKKIINSLIGLVIAWGSFAILYNVNPNLIEFNALKVKIANTIPLDVFEKPDYEDDTSSISSSDLDPLFKAYASCYGYDPAILKAVATVESGLKPYANPGETFQGLFQMTQKYCDGGIKAGKYPVSLKLDCNNRIDPETNTAAAAATFNQSLKKIVAKCPQIKFQDAMSLLYVGHNNGPAIMDALVQAESCTEDSMRINIRKHYESNGTKLSSKTCKPASMVAQAKYAKIYGHDLNGETKAISCVTADWAVAKLEVGIKAAKLASSGNSTIFSDGMKNDGLCPQKTGKRAIGQITNNSGKKVLALGDSLTADAHSHAVQLKAMGINLERVAVVGKNTQWMLDQINGMDLKAQGFTDLIILGGANDIPGGTSANIVEEHLRQIYQKAKAANMRVIALTITPFFNYYEQWTPEKQAALEDVNNWIRARGDGNIDIVIDANQIVADPSDKKQILDAYDDNFPSYTDNQGRIFTHHERSIHFNAAGHAAIAAEEKAKAF